MAYHSGHNLGSPIWGDLFVVCLKVHWSCSQTEVFRCTLWPDHSLVLCPRCVVCFTVFTCL